jgi:17beta-estradiol 17-dehydrogenase / very-long-chain 3-oxoacyl-CoA reductase
MNYLKEDPSTAIVGAICLTLALKALNNLYKTFLRPAKNLKKLGKWAVVTGATGKS